MTLLCFQCFDESPDPLPMNLPARAGTRRSLLPPGEGLGMREEMPPFMAAIRGASVVASRPAYLPAGDGLRQSHKHLIL